MTKPLLFLLALAVVLGVSLGGAFILGIALGKSQADDATDLPGLSALGPGGPPVTEFDRPGQAGRFPQRSTGDGPGSGYTGSPGLQFSGQGEPGSGDVLAGRGGLMGTVERVDGNTVTINTPQGPVQAVIDDDASITRVVDGTLEDLRMGVQVRMMGEEREGEDLKATSVIIIPEETEGPLGPGLSGQEGSPQERLGRREHQLPVPVK